MESLVEVLLWNWLAAGPPVASIFAEFEAPEVGAEARESSMAANGSPR